MTKRWNNFPLLAIAASIKQILLFAKTSKTRYLPCVSNAPIVKPYWTSMIASQANWLPAANAATPSMFRSPKPHLEPSSVTSSCFVKSAQEAWGLSFLPIRSVLTETWP